MTAIILAGGLGTRLKSVIKDLPKCMAPINGTPFLSLILKNLSKNGFKKVIIAVGYLSEIITSFYGKKFDRIEIHYSLEKEPLGTGGAILKALNNVEDEYFFVLNGDTFFDIDFKEMYKNKSNFLIASKQVKNTSRFGHLVFEKNILTGFGEKGNFGQGFINGGVYLIKKSFLEKFNFNSKFSFEKDFLEKFVNLNQFRIIKFDNTFIDIGVPSDYYLAQNLFKNE